MMLMTDGRAFWNDLLTGWQLANRDGVGAISAAMTVFWKQSHCWMKSESGGKVFLRCQMLLQTRKSFGFIKIQGKAALISNWTRTITTSSSKVIWRIKSRARSQVLIRKRQTVRLQARQNPVTTSLTLTVTLERTRLLKPPNLPSASTIPGRERRNHRSNWWPLSRVRIKTPWYACNLRYSFWAWDQADYNEHPSKYK